MRRVGGRRLDGNAAGSGKVAQLEEIDEEDGLDSLSTPSVFRTVAKTLPELESRIAPSPINLDHPELTVSRNNLRMFEKQELSSYLYENKGRISSSIIIRFASFYGMRIKPKQIQQSWVEVFDTPFTTHADDDAESESSDDDFADFKPKRLSCAPQKVKQLVAVLRRELKLLHKEIVEGITANRNPPAETKARPLYKESSQGITKNEADFRRIKERNIFTSNRLLLESSSGRQSSLSQSDDVADNMSTISVDTDFSQSTFAGLEFVSHPRTRGRLVLHMHPLKDPAVFSSFYPSAPTAQARELPIFQYEAQIVRLLEDNQVTIISGMTGTGKTTQVPLMVMDYCAKLGLPCNIIVTQPRKLAAIGIAQRVCRERDWKVGQLVGFHVGLDRNVSSSTRLTYCTTGVFVERIVGSKHLNDYTHIFLDEVHERSQDTDLSLMLVRQMLKENSPDVNVVLMSATAEVSKLQSYFTDPSMMALADVTCGFIHVKESVHLVSEAFLDDFAVGELPRGLPFKYGDPVLPHALLSFAVDCIEKLLPWNQNGSDSPESVLIFLPGLEHIIEMEQLLKAAIDRSNLRYDIVILHSTISRAEQIKVIDPAPPGVRRVILSTNIAESSVTIPYINHVFDFCLTKALRVNPLTKSSQLILQWASRASCAQRRGRVGRVRPGRVFFFVPRSLYAELSPHPEPEVLIAPLENTVLRVKTLKVEVPPAEVMALLPDPPKLNDVSLALMNLKQAGALTVSFNGRPCETDGDLTALGQFISVLPLDIRVARFLALCCMFGAVYEGLIIAAGLTVESPFLSNRWRDPKFVKLLHEIYGEGSFKCDACAMLKAFTMWSKQTFKSHREERQWCEERLIDLPRIKEMAALRKELTSRLTRRAILEAEPMPMEKVLRLIPILFAGAFYPSILVNQVSIDDKINGKRLRGLDPMRTCIIADFGYKANFSMLYERQLRSVLHLKPNVEIVYGPTDTFICFPRSEMFGSEQPHIGLVQLQNLCDQTRRVELDAQETVCPLSQLATMLPSPLRDAESRFQIGNPVGHVPANTALKRTELVPITDDGLIWLNSWDEETQAQQAALDKRLRSCAFSESLRPVGRDRLQIGQAYMCVDSTDRQVARCEYLRPVDDGNFCLVSVVDFGMYDKVPISWLHELPEELASVPPASFQFKFAGIRFTDVHEKEALAYLRELAESGKNTILLKIYSVLDEVVRGDLFITSNVLPGTLVHLNEELLLMGLAYSSKENFISQDDNKHRNFDPPAYFPAVRDLPVLPPFSSRPTRGKITVGPLLFPSNTKLVTMDSRRVAARVVWNSLNCFSCDPNPQDDGLPYRPIVTGRLSHPSNSQERLRAALTSALPVRPGLLGLIGMLFAARVRLHVRNGGYIGASTGLGPHGGQSFYPDGDVNVVLEGKITQDDVTSVNRLRSGMNAFLNAMQGRREQVESMTVVQEENRKMLLSLVEKSRPAVPFQSLWEKSLWYPQELEVAQGEEFHKAERCFLVPIIREQVASKNDLDDPHVELHRITMRRMVEGGTEAGAAPLFCPSCEVTIPSGGAIYDHLHSSEHRSFEDSMFDVRRFRNRLVVPVPSDAS